MKPFLKWVGGKRWLTQKYPDLFALKFKRYVEPFLGSGAVFFHVAPARSFLSDINSELVNVYSCIRADHQRVYAKLRSHARHHSDRYYYEVRSKKFRSPFSRAAQMLYLNRTCWNGLYRENLKGEFNVPRGTKDSVLLADDDFASVAKLLSTATITSCDFEDVITQTRRGDFVFIDPPYTVRHNSNGFIKYNESIFSWSDQERLASVLKRKAGSGAAYLLTNAYHPSVIDLYSKFARIIPAERASVLSADRQHRGRTKEAIILIGDNSWALDDLEGSLEHRYETARRDVRI